jgi:hypothetical protein
MKLFTLLKNWNLVAMVAAGASLLSPIAQAADVAQCPLQNATMNGTYVVTGSGTIAGLGPLVSVGLIVYNGDGTGVAISGTSSVNGSTSTAGNAPITFTVNRDCTGSKTIGSGPSAAHMNFVITPDGKTITWIATDPGVTVMGTAERLRK